MSNSRKGFASMTPERHREIASSGGKAAHASGKAHKFTSEEARAAGRKGGRTVSEKGIGHKFTSRSGREAVAKRWTGKKKPAEKLTDLQLNELANYLVDTTANVYRVTEAKFNVTVGEEIFDQLEKIEDGGIFRCENCSQWCPLDVRNPDISNFCSPCVAEIDDNESEPETE